MQVMNIKEMAKLAGVSCATISRVLNDSGYVKEDTRKKVMGIIKEYNYTPNMIARSLSSKDSFTIGMIIPGVGEKQYGKISVAFLENQFVFVLLVKFFHSWIERMFMLWFCSIQNMKQQTLQFTSCSETLICGFKGKLATTHPFKNHGEVVIQQIPLFAKLQTNLLCQFEN